MKYSFVGEVYFSLAEIEERSLELAHQIEQEWNSEVLDVIPIYPGSEQFLADLMRGFKRLKVRSFPCISYATENSEPVVFLSDTYDEVKQPLLVVPKIDKIVLRSLQHVAMEFFNRGIEGISICTLLLTNDVSDIDLLVKYAGFTIPNIPLVGYGLTYKHLGADLLAIFQVSEHDA